MKNLKITLSLCLIALTIGCSVTETKDNHNIILFDISGSLNAGNLEELSEEARRIFDELKYNDKLTVLQIDTNPGSQKPIFHYEMPDVPTKPSLERQYEKEIEDKEEEMDSLIIARYDFVRGDKKFEHYRNSCIINSIIAANKFSSDTSNYKYRLFIFSDMIEDCSDSPFGKIVLKRETIDEVKKAIEASDVKLPDISHMSINVLLTLKYGKTNQQVLNEREKEKVWKDIFRKFGLTTDEVEKITFASTVSGFNIK